MITAEQERDLIVRAQAGDKTAVGDLLRAHEGYIRKVAAKSAKGDPDKFDDCFQEANIAAMEALAGFDVSLNLRFLTYATKKIGWGLQEHHASDQLIATPRSWNYAKGSNEMRERADAARRLVAIDAPAGDRDAGIAGLLPAPEESDHAEHHESLNRLNSAIASLNERYQTIIKRRMMGETLESIAQFLGCTKEWIRQNELKAMLELREFLERKQSQVLRGPTMIELVCDECHDRFKRRVGDVNRARKNGRNVFFCNNRCAARSEMRRRGMKPWTLQEINFARAAVTSGQSVRSIAHKLGRTFSSTTQGLSSHGITKKSWWKKVDVEYLRDKYQKISTTLIARALNRTEEAVRMKAFLLGLAGTRLPRYTHAAREGIIAMLRSGMNDQMVATRLGRERHSISRIRRGAGIRAIRLTKDGAAVARINRAATMKKRYGMSNSEKLLLHHRVAAIRLGWPQAETARQAQIMEFLSEQAGTREQIALAISGISPTKKGHYMISQIPRLIQLGLIVKSYGHSRTPTYSLAGGSLRLAS